MEKQKTVNLQEVQRAYFIGIGGIGMSAIARYLHRRGISVSGYDKTETVLTKKLVEEGIAIHYDDDPAQIPAGVDLVVYTPAIPADHRELAHLRQGAHPVYKRAAVLGLISQSRQTIAIAGTHGKTTTSAILSHLLHRGGIDCTAFLGGIAQNFASNYVAGAANWVVVEADEYDRSFLHLYPDIAVVLSTDADHLDIYGERAALLESFRDFAEQTHAEGRIFLKRGIDFAPWTGKTRATVADYGLAEGTYRSENLRVVEGQFVFDYASPHGTIKDIVFPLPGRHNVENATVAIAVAEQLGLGAAAIKPALASFKGIKRRFETIFRGVSVVYIDDYAHHPTELAAAIGAARELYPERKLTGIFQPHLYSRTRDFVEGFARALEALDEVILLDIYPARELPLPGVTSASIAERMQHPRVEVMAKEGVLSALPDYRLEVLLTLGAGDIDTLVLPIKKQLEDEYH
ncbi:MAG: UDP-N-acetylmuramate--L-alanine ligase [Bacteroidota bacterium]